jgi:hypothetical protein
MAARQLGVVVALAAGLTGSAASCSHDPDEFPDPDLPAAPTNPDGVPYPTDHLGGVKRAGNIPGNRIPNLTFRAYKDGLGGGLGTVSMADYFDPTQKRNKVLDIQIAATWCAICSAEVDATITVTEPLKARGVVFVEVLVSGATASKGPSLDEVNAWIDGHKSNYPTGIDVRGRRVGTLGINATAVPYDILIDTRTMEILDSSVGAPIDVGQYALDGLRFVDSHPPSYGP